MRAGFLVLSVLVAAGLSGCDDEAPVTATTSSSASKASASTFDALRLPALLERAVSQELATPLHLAALRARLGSAGDLGEPLQRAANDTERMLILKVFAAGSQPGTIKAYADEIRGKDPADIVRLSTMREPDNLMQQYQQTCGEAMVQVALAELNPIYAWELHKNYQLHKLDPEGANLGLAKEQREWLESYGGKVTARGAEGGIESGLTAILNEKLGAAIGCTYAMTPATNLRQTLVEITAQVKRGYPTAIRVAFGIDNGHFMLIQAARDGAFRVYDPYYGTVRWQPTSAFEAGSLVAESSQTARLTHYFRSIPRG